MDKENWFEEQFVLALEDLDPHSTTGLGPLQHWGADVKTALLRDDLTGSYAPERVAMLKELVRRRLLTPEEPDPILVFVKPEPHKKAKIAEGRLRLISAVGLVDTMADRVMLRWLQKAALETVGRTPAMIGWSPYCGGYRYLTQKFAYRKSLAADKSSWDWTVKGWLLVLVKKLIKRMAVAAPDWWEEWLDRRWEALFRDAVFGFRTGERIQQDGWGVMKSGCYLTLFLNSVCQAALHSIACRKLQIEPEWDYFHAMGDDTLQAVVEPLEEYLQVLRDLGAVIKAWEVKDEVEFCGHVMHRLNVVPSYATKHVFSVLNCQPSTLPEVLRAYQAAYTCEPTMWDWLTRCLLKVAPEYHQPRVRTLQWIHG